MSIIQQIREKAGWFVFILIGLSLLGFLLMDAFVGKSGRGLFGGNSSSIGSINGSNVDAIDYQKKLKMMEDQYAASGYPVNEMMRQNIQDQVWNQYVDDAVLTEETGKVGLSVPAKELDDILFGANPPQDLKQQFTNDRGEFDVNAAKNAIANLRKQKNNPVTENFNNIYLPALMQNRMREKYSSLLGNSFYVPKWIVEKLNADNSQRASIKYVNISYSSISDSTADVKVSDSDISDYVSKHKDEYKQDASRTIAYVVFNAAPTAADTNQVIAQSEALRNEYAVAADPNAFLVRNGSDVPYFDGYVVKSKMQVPNADSIQRLADGAVFGPYVDAGKVVLAKMIGKRSIADSVKVRHILISTQNGTPDSIAQKRIDSIATAIKGGANFAALCQQVTDDAGSKEKGGEYDFSSQQFGTLAKEFAEFAFYGTTGEKKVVKTSFGYHYIEILNQKNFEQAYKVAYLSKPILASQETENAASGAANQFAGESRNAKAFDETVKKRNYNKLIAGEIKPNDNTIAGIGSSRKLVRWVNDASKGDVSDPEPVDDKFIVAMLTEINKEGLMDVSKARPMVEYLIRNQKKAAVINKKIGAANTLEAIATATGSQVQVSDSIRWSSPYIPNVGQELKVIGAAFDKSIKGKVSKPIAGNGAVFVLTTENIIAEANANGTIDQQREVITNQAKNQGAYRSVEALKRAADVKDERAKIF